VLTTLHKKLLNLMTRKLWKLMVPLLLLTSKVHVLQILLRGILQGMLRNKSMINSGLWPIQLWQGLLWIPRWSALHFKSTWHHLLLFYIVYLKKGLSKAMIKIEVLFILLLHPWPCLHLIHWLMMLVQNMQVFLFTMTNWMV